MNTLLFSFFPSLKLLVNLAAMTELTQFGAFFLSSAETHWAKKANWACFLLSSPAPKTHVTLWQGQAPVKVLQALVSAATTDDNCPSVFFSCLFFVFPHPAFSALLVHTCPHCSLLPTHFRPFHSDLVHEIHLECNMPSAGGITWKTLSTKKKPKRSSKARAALRQWRRVNQVPWFSASSLHLQFTWLYIAFSQCFISPALLKTLLPSACCSLFLPF